MKPNRRLAVARAVGVFAAALACTGVAAQPFPSKPVKILVGSAAGGGTDIMSRMIAGKLADLWGQPVVVENRTGASATIAADFVAKAPADGYTVLMAVPNSHTIATHLVKVPYDALRDFTPITLAAFVPQVLVVGQGMAPNTMAELVALAKAEPGKLNFSSSGIGSTQHLAGEMFNLAAGVKTVHVPYKGSAAAMADLISGTVNFSLDTTASAMGQISAKKLKPLAVTAPRRAAALPNVPTTAEAGFPGVDIGTWYGLFAPPNMPRALLDKWHQDVATVLQMPDVRQRIIDLGGEAGGNKPEEFGAYVRAEYAKMGKLVRDANVKAE
jgi:tripartite-type tricarboxylate transporter receptor subunit TctC